MRLFEAIRGQDASEETPDELAVAPAPPEKPAAKPFVHVEVRFIGERTDLMWTFGKNDHDREIDDLLKDAKDFVDRLLGDGEGIWESNGRTTRVVRRNIAFVSINVRNPPSTWTLVK